jgi:hypothetical protein
MNQLDQLIRELEGADYHHGEEETRIPLWRGMIPAILVAWAIIIAGWWVFG